MLKNALKYAIGESECWNAETLNCQKNERADDA